MTHFARRFGATLAASALLAACGTNTGQTNASTNAETGAQTDTGATAQSNTAEAASSDVLKFTGTALDGSTFDGETLAGKPVVFWFWAPWCPTCRGQIADVEALAEQYGDEVAVIAVGGLDSGEAIEDLAGEIDGVTHLVDPDGKIWKHFSVTAQSTFTVLDADGSTASQGYLEADELKDLVAELAEA